MSRELIVVSVNHRSAPVEVRERLAFSGVELAGLGESFISLSAVQEAVVLSTCNRVEVVACCDDPAGVGAALARRLMSAGGLDHERHEGCLEELRGREAVRHVFRVAASLDSMVVGEPQVLGQMKEQFTLSTGSAGPVLHKVFDRAFSVAKRVRSETGIAARAVSVASAAVDLACKIFEDLGGRSVILLGAGEMGELTARHLAGSGARRLMVANRSFGSAVELARSLDGTPVPFERIPMYLPLADLVVGSSAGGVMLEAESVSAAMDERRGVAMFFIDLAVPRNFDAAINNIDNVYLYDIDDLTEVAEENLTERRRDAVAGEILVEEAVEGFWGWLEKLEVVPTIVELRELAESIRRDEVERTLRRMTRLSGEEREGVESMSRAIVNKLLHQPTSVLKEERSTSEESRLLSALQRLFRLGREG